MRTFSIDADDLNAWFARVSPDCVSSPHYGYGDLRRMGSSEFYNHALRAWGLRQLGAVPFDGYKFEIIDEATFRRWGFSRWGTVNEE